MVSLSAGLWAMLFIRRSSVPPGDDASQDGGPSQSRDPESLVEARVDIRRLQQFLVGQQVNPSKAMCSESPPHVFALKTHQGLIHVTV